VGAYVIGYLDEVVENEGKLFDFVFYIIRLFVKLSERDVIVIEKFYQLTTLHLQIYQRS